MIPFQIIVAAAVVAVVVPILAIWGVAAAMGGTNPGIHESARGILAKRLARGEISLEDYKKLVSEI
jgi:uncharacterized membrane protein